MLDLWGFGMRSLYIMLNRAGALGPNSAGSHRAHGYCRGLRSLSRKQRGRDSGFTLRPARHHIGDQDAS